MKKASKTFPLLLAASLAFGCFSGTAYAINMGVLHTQHVFYDLSYVYRCGWDLTPEFFPTLKSHSYMWVRNNVRTVGEGAIFSQAGLTHIEQTFLRREVRMGPGVWNSGPNPAGVAVEDYYNEQVPLNTSVLAWGNGFVRDPNSQYHHCPTEEHLVFSYA